MTLNDLKGEFIALMLYYVLCIRRASIVATVEAKVTRFSLKIISI